MDRPGHGNPARGRRDGRIRPGRRPDGPGPGERVESRVDPRTGYAGKGRPMEFELTESQAAWQEAAIRFAREELAEGLDLDGRDGRREFWREGWARCARFGIHGLPIPAEHGGKGLGLPETIAAMEGLGYACPDNGLIFAINASMWTVAIPILRFGTDDQRRRHLPGLCDGSIVGANGASEPGAGSEIFSMVARARREGG